MDIFSDVVRALAPTGRLRASINLGNPILATLDASGNPAGVSVDLSVELARRLDLPIDLVVFDSAGKSVEAVTREEADFGFFAIDPIRGAGIAFTAPYLLIEGAYLVKEESTIQSVDEVDQAGRLIAVGGGSAYDLFLTRELRYAHIVRAPTSPAVVDTFVEHDLDVAAGVRQQLEADAARIGGLRLLPGRFMVIQQAMGLPKARAKNAIAALQSFVEDVKSSGFVNEALRRNEIEGATLAPPAST
ncbi:ABC transporter substrate-binding protein [Variovorax sp. J22G21]|uniref:ABC transporter substrate-binding protein n=1 Tax=Variovorax fucosicus TaxID=3053517 RepID=UPI002575C497|nr:MULTISPECIES: ABC transporter substrate-binding protein [unclassified Variovorax]MDM0040164.1 ABC transporter substrate-binding protein [Variovorax sp. J22R193]MDM0061537.1 ABC transporter substrate-binding protein [Variovorax sp. J22G21]